MKKVFFLMIPVLMLAACQPRAAKVPALDLSNLEGTARTLAQQQGKDLNALANEVKAAVNKLM